MTSAWVMNESTSESPASASSMEGVSGIDEMLEVFLPPPDNVTSRGQQLPISTVNSVGGGLLPPPEALDGLPEFLRG